MSYFYIPLSSENYQKHYSAEDVQREYYFKHNVILSFHTIGGGLWLISGIIQFIPQFRSKYPIIHRINGWIYVLCVIISLIGSFNLLREAGYNLTYDTYSGPLFKVILGMYWFGGFVSFTFGIFFILFQRISIHRQFMIVSYSLACGAPFLRWCWVVAYWIDNNSTMEENNISCTIAMVGILSLAVHLTVSYGDTQNERNLKRLWQCSSVSNDSNPNDYDGNTINNEPQSTSGSEQIAMDIYSARASENGGRGDTEKGMKGGGDGLNKGYIGTCMIFVLCVINTVFGTIIAMVWMTDEYKDTWFDNKESGDANVALRVLHWLVWVIMSYFASVMVIVVINDDITIMNIKFDINKVTIILGILSCICGVVTFIYVSTFDRNKDSMFYDTSAVVWIINASSLWCVYYLVLKIH